MRRGDLRLDVTDPAPAELARMGLSLEPWSGSVLPCPAGATVHLAPCTPRPWRIDRLACHPDAERTLAPIAQAAILVVVLDPGRTPPLQALAVPPGSRLRIAAGTWHAGPVLLVAGGVLEVLAGAGPTDRMDLRGVAELCGYDTVIVQPAAPSFASAAGEA